MSRLPVPAAWTRLVERVDAWPARERAALLMVAVVALVAVEFVWVQPLLGKTRLIQGAVARQQDAAAGAIRQREREAADEQVRLRARLSEVEAELVRRGALRASATPAQGPAARGAASAAASLAPGESLGEWLSRTVPDTGVRVAALRVLDVETVEATGGSGAAAAPRRARGQPPATEATGSAAGTATLFRHRFELTLSGPPADLVTAVDSLAARLAPLRLAQARLSADDGQPVQARLTFVVLSTERTWISL